MTLKNILISIPNPEAFIGAVVKKSKTVSTCTDVEAYTRQDGQKTKLLVWECVFIATGEKIIRKTSCKSFKISDLPGSRKAFEKCA